MVSIYGIHIGWKGSHDGTGFYLETSSAWASRDFDLWAPRSPRPCLSPPVPMHGGLLCVAFCLSVRPSVRLCKLPEQKSLEKMPLEKKSLEKNSYLSNRST